MALVSGTYTRYGGSSGATNVPQGLRESLSDLIYNISPTATPFMSGAGVGAAGKQTLIEWQTDTLAAAASNAQLEGDEAAYTTPAATVRVGNYMQISRKTVNISDTLEEVDKAGRRSETAFQTMKRAKELKRDMEADLLRAQGGGAGAVGSARTLAGLNAFIKANDDVGSNGASPAYTSGVPGAARTDGTQRAFTETILKAVLSLGFTSGAEFSTLMVGPFNKDTVSGFSGIATRNFDLSNVSPRPTAIIASADVYVSNFGVIRVIPNRFQRERDAWLLDWDMVALRYLRPFKAKPMAKTGDATKKLLIVEYTLEVKQEAGLGLCADLNTS